MDDFVKINRSFVSLRSQFLELSLNSKLEKNYSQTPHSNIFQHRKKKRYFFAQFCFFFPWQSLRGHTHSYDNSVFFLSRPREKTNYSYECVCPRKLCQGKKNKIAQFFCKSKQKADNVPIKLNYQPWNCGSRLIRG